MSAALDQTACTATYRDVERLLDKMCWDFQARWGGEFDEHRGVANLAYMRAYRTWDGGKASFVTYVWWCVRNALQSSVRRQRRWVENVVVDTDLMELVCSTAEEFDAENLMHGLSEDARVMVRLVLDVFGDLAAAFRPERAPAVREALTEGLDDRWWSPKRVTDTLAEIGTALFG